MFSNIFSAEPKINPLQDLEELKILAENDYEVSVLERCKKLYG